MSRKNFLRVLMVVFGAIIFIWFSSVNPSVIKWILSADPTVMAAVITGSLTIVGSVSITSINARRAQENAAVEANRGEKSQIYNEFVVAMMKMLNGKKAKEGRLTESSLEFMHDFSSQIMVYGGPEVIKAYGKWQEFGASTKGEQRDEQMKMMGIFENLLLAIRKELEVSNEGLKKNELLGLIIRGGKSELDKMGGSTQD